MPTLPVNPENLARAAALLRAGELVAFPTETVYGLGANALDASAVGKIYHAKGRPSNNPLIVHVLGAEEARRLVAHWPDNAQMLAERFWPGPLTLVLPRSHLVPDAVTGGGDTVAVRVPAHPVARQLLEASGLALAAPSANRSNHLSPTQAAHVSGSLDASILVLDGGSCEVGIESTVLSLAEDPPVLLRPGSLGLRELQALVGPVRLGGYAVSEQVEGTAPLPSPGMLGRHYAPKARVQLFSTLIDAHFHAVIMGQGRRLGVMAFGPTSLDAIQIVMPDDPTAYARQLFTALHQLDDSQCDVILIEAVPVTPDWDGVRDRLTRASVMKN